MTRAYRVGEMAGATDFEYQLQRGGEEGIVATGSLLLEHAPAVGDQLTIGGRVGVVRSIVPAIAGRRPRLIIELISG